MDARQQQMADIIRELRKISRLIQAQAKFVEQHYGLSSARLWMLWELFAHPGLKVSELAKLLAIHPSTCSNALDRLEVQGFLRRTRSDRDQRTVRLYLTEAGERLLAGSSRPTLGALGEALNMLGQEDLDHLDTGLMRLAQVINPKAVVDAAPLEA
ncbi:MAG: MarR family winged helix-turn-helix transcriptional regulator [Thermodesulfobacteriota bacterium]